MFVLGYGEKQSKNDKNNFEIPNLLSCEWGNPEQSILYIRRIQIHTDVYYFEFSHRYGED